MSLSRIIKADCVDVRSASPVSFDSFHEIPRRAGQESAAGFTPFVVSGVSPKKEEAAAEVEASRAEQGLVAVDEGMIVITEEELDDRLREAYVKGVEEQKKQADEDLAGICSALSQAVSLVSRLRERIIRESEEELLQLSFLVAKKIIRQEIKHDRQIMAQVVSEALKEFPEQHDIIICLNPDDCRVISSNRELYLAGVGNDRQITLKADEAMTIGGCLVESSMGVIDARIEAQLDEIYRSLMEEKNLLCNLTEDEDKLALAEKELTP